MRVVRETAKLRQDLGLCARLDWEGARREAPARSHEDIRNEGGMRQIVCMLLLFGTYRYVLKQACQTALQEVVALCGYALPAEHTYTMASERMLATPRRTA